jgi:hypothetical protein
MAIASLETALRGPLSSDQQHDLLAAKLRAKTIRRASGVAALNGWSIAIFAAISLPCAMWSWPTLILEVGLAVVAFNEFRGRDGLRRFDPAAAHRLGWNQLGLWALLAGYSVWSIGSALIMPNSLPEALLTTPELGASMQESIGRLYLAVTIAVYGGMIVGTTVMQGLNAWYYFSRHKHVLAYLHATPAWVIDVQRVMGG